MSAGHAEAPADVVVIFGHTWWERAVQRGRHRAEDRLITHLLESPRVGRLVVADNPRDWLSHLYKRLRGEQTEPLPTRPDDLPASRFRPHRLLRREDVTSRAASFTARRYSRRLGAHARRHGLQEPQVVCLNPLLAGFGPFEWARSVTYFATDDWASHSQFSRQWDVIEQSYRLVRSRGRSIAAVSQAIVDRVASGDPGAGLVVPNGVDPADWSSPGAPPAWVEDVARPLAVYLGAVAEQRLDLPFVEAVASELQGTVAVVGPVQDHDIAAALTQIAGVRVFPPVTFGDIPGLLSAADLALLPHRRTPLTESMSPLKVYEALAAGIPVLATDLPPIRNLSECAVLLDEGDDVSGGVRRALDLRERARAEAAAFADANAWATRFDALLDHVLAAPARPAGVAR